MQSQVLIVVGLMLFLIPHDALALDADINRKTLHGIDAILVVVEESTPDGVELGVSPDSIQKEVESTLRQAGIRVVDQNEWLSLPGSPYLYLQTSVVKVDRRGTYAFSVNTSVLQDVVLKRAPEVALAEAATWSVGSHGHTDRGHPEFIQKAVDELVEQFLEAYNDANGRVRLTV